MSEEKQMKVKILDTVPLAQAPAQHAIRVDDGENVVVIGFSGNRQEAEDVVLKLTGAEFAVLPTIEEALEWHRKQAALVGEAGYYE